MSSILKMTSFLLFVLIISSCASNRIRYAQIRDNHSITRSWKAKRKSFTCTSLGDKHSDNKNNLMWSILTFNRSTAPALHKTGKKKNSSSTLNRRRKQGTNSDEFISRLNNSGIDHDVSDDHTRLKLEQLKMSEDESIRWHISEFSQLGVSIQNLNDPIDISYISGVSTDSIVNHLTHSYDSYHMNQAHLNKENHEKTIAKMISDNSDESLHHSIKKNQLQKQYFHNKESLIYLMTLLAGCLSFTSIRNKQNFSRNLSHWASLNPWKTRFIITGIHILTGTAGIILGKKLAESATSFSDISKNLTVAIFLTTALLYPVRKAPGKLFKHTYLRQKTHDLALFLTGFILMVNVGNHYSKLMPSFASMFDAKNLSKQNELPAVNTIQSPTQLMFYQSESQIQKELPVPHHKGSGIGVKILLTVLALAAACGLGYGLAVLSCSIACSGSEGFAALVGIVGGITIIGLLIWALKSIFKPKPKRISSVSYNT